MCCRHSNLPWLSTRGWIIKRLSAESLKREDRALKRGRVAIEQGKAIHASYEASKVKVDDLKSELEASDHVRLKLIDRLKTSKDRSVAQDEDLRQLTEKKEK